MFGTQNAFGRFRHLKSLEWARVERLVFVCQGNICRSPVAAAYAAQQMDFPSISFGLNCRDGAPADPRAISFAGSVGIDLHGHRSRHIRAYEPLASDLVVAMEPAHLGAMKDPRLAALQLTLLGLWLPSATPYIHDPFTSDATHFIQCEKMVVDAVIRMFSYLGQ